MLLVGDKVSERLAEVALIRNVRCLRMCGGVEASEDVDSHFITDPKSMHLVIQSLSKYLYSCVLECVHFVSQ